VTERVLVLVPAFNAVGTVADVVRECKSIVPDVLVVDDGSADATGSAAAAAGAHVLRHPHNRGKGAALKTGFAYALQNGYDAVITLDADGQHLPGEIPKFLACRGEARGDLIIGGRAHLFHQMLPRRRMRSPTASITTRRIVPPLMRSKIPTTILSI